MLTARNNRAVKGFVNDIAITMTSFGRSTIQQAAKIGLRHLVHEAGFNDYTGKLVNSYQAAILTKGGIEERVKYQTGRGRTVIESERGIQKLGRPNGTPIVMTSYGIEGTSKIHHRTKIGTNRSGRTYKGFPMQKRRDGGESPEIRGMKKVWGRNESAYSKGFGAYMTRIKGIAPPISSGYWLVFDNPAPYAQSVHKGEGYDHRGRLVKGTPHRVFPTVIDGINLFGIGQKELKRTLAAMKRHRR